MDLSNLGQREEALAASQEAVDIYRRLAASRPDAFLPLLATSIGALSDVFTSMGRHREAAEAAQEALGLLLPFVERYPDRFAGLGALIGKNVISYCEAAGLEPDTAMLERLVKVLQGQSPG